MVVVAVPYVDVDDDGGEECWTGAVMRADATGIMTAVASFSTIDSSSSSRSSTFVVFCVVST